MINLQIDEKCIQVEEGISVLEAALQNGIYIPHLCHHPDLPELGACRLCIVEVDGHDDIRTSCTLQVKEGMKVRTTSQRINHLRRLAMELILAAHPEHCTGCPKYGRCEMQLLIQNMDATAARMHARVKRTPANINPLIVHDMVRCVLCGRCVRACDNLRDVGVLRYNKKNMEVYVGTLHDKLLADADCRFCGACAEVCPTGAIRDVMNFEAPQKRKVLLPCVDNCPAHTDIPTYIRYAKEGEFGKATAVIREKLPFPECLGRVCEHDCELECRRGQLNDSISIREIKRVCAERDAEQLWKKNAKQLPPSGKKVAVVGGGPAGMTAAIYLAKQGHAVTLFEAQEKLGGQMQYGIPAYRLPRDVVDKECNYVYELGIDVRCCHRVERPAELLSDYNAVLVAGGTHAGICLELEGSQLPGVLVCSEFLRNAAKGIDTGIGKKVCVLGAGNVAFDCARTAVRLGAERVSIICRKSKELLSVSKDEIEESLEEGVQILDHRSFEKIHGENAVTGMEVALIERITYGEAGVQVELKPDSAEILDADTVIFAVGQGTGLDAASGLPLSKSGRILVEEGYAAVSSMEGVFACGDAVTGTRSVVEAIAAARSAASEIDRFLGGDGDIDERLCPREPHNPKIGLCERFATLERIQPQMARADRRKSHFEPVSDGIFDGVSEEAVRCMQCDLRFDIKAARPWTAFRNSEHGGGQQ